MSKSLQELNQIFAEFDESPAGYGAELRLDLAEIIWRGLARNKWTQRKLAQQSGLADAVISNLVHGNKNCTLDTVGVVLHALGAKAKLVETLFEETTGYTIQGVDYAATTGASLEEWNYGQAPKIGTVETYHWIKADYKGTEGWWDSAEPARDSESSYNLGRPNADIAPPRLKRGDVAFFRVRTSKQHG